MLASWLSWQLCLVPVADRWAVRLTSSFSNFCVQWMHTYDVCACACVCVCVRVGGRVSRLQVQRDAAIGWINAVSRIWWKVAPRLHGPLKHSGRSIPWMCIDLLLSEWPLSQTCTYTGSHGCRIASNADMHSDAVMGLSLDCHKQGTIFSCSML